MTPDGADSKDRNLGNEAGQSESVPPVSRREYLKSTGAITGISLMGEGAAKGRENGEDNSEKSMVENFIPTNLQVDYSRNQLAIDDKQPLLSWQIESERRFLFQSAYRILVSSTQEKLQAGVADMWDSGKVDSDQTAVEYAGEELESGRGYYWRVRVWDQEGNASAWSDTAHWGMGLLDASAWQADWIRRDPPTKWTREKGDNVQIEDGQLRVTNGGSTRTERGDDWTNYNFHFDIERISGSVGWIFRSPNEESGYLWRLNPEDENVTLDSYVLRDGNRTLLDSIPVDESELGPQYGVEIEVNGSRIRTFIDNKLIDDRINDTYTKGRIGFEAGPSGTAEIQMVNITDTSANILYTDNFGSFDRQGPVDPHFTYLRNEFDLGSSPITRARVYVAASHQYKLHINGEKVDKGPSFCFPSDQYYKVLDITDELQEGINAIGALHTWVGPGQGRPTSEPGFLLQLSVRHTDGRERTITTDGSWNVKDGAWQPAYERGAIGEPIEVIDGRAIPTGWTEPGFNDQAWNDAYVIGSHPTPPWERLISQEREVVRRPGVKPESLTRLESGDYVADFGKVYAAVPRVQFEEGEAGRRIDMQAGYLLQDDGQVSTTRGTQDTYMSFSYIQRDGKQVFHPFFYLGFRYLQIEDPGEPLNCDQVTLQVRHNGVPDRHAATFSSSNDVLDAVWDLARHSALYGSQEQFVDTPTREKGQFLGDSFNISSTTIQAFGERKLTQQALREFMRSQERYWEDEGRLNAVYPIGNVKRDIPDYTEKFAEWVWRYYENTGDRELLEEAYPVLKDVAGYVARYIDPGTGLITNLAGGGGAYQFGIVDWPKEMRYGYDMDTVVRTTVNALGVNVFRRTAQIAEELDQPRDEIQRYRERAEKLTNTINARLTHPDGTYVDGIKPDGSKSVHASQHANAFPLALNIVPSENVDTVADFIAQKGMSMGPMTVQRLLTALGSTGRYSELIELITDPSHDGWADILQKGGTFTWESWDSRELTELGRSESHPWGATVLRSIQEFLLGVAVDDVRAANITITPPSEGLSSAEGRVPTERGNIVVAWKRDPTFRITVKIPANTKATVRLPPQCSGAEITESDTVICSDGKSFKELPRGIEAVTSKGDDDRIAIEIGSGTYQFEAQ